MKFSLRMLMNTLTTMMTRIRPEYDLKLELFNTFWIDLFFMIKPVSYTHLDVDKRQEANCPKPLPRP